MDTLYTSYGQIHVFITPEWTLLSGFGHHIVSVFRRSRLGYRDASLLPGTPWHASCFNQRPLGVRTHK